MARENETPIPYEEDLSAFLDGELDGEREQEIRAELGRNPTLAARLEALAAVDAELRAIPARSVPDELHTRLRARIAAQTSGVDGPASSHRTPASTPRAPRRRRRWLGPSAVAAAAVVAALAWLVFLARPSGDLPEERFAEEAPQPERFAEEAPQPERLAEQTPQPERAPALQIEAPEAGPPSRIAESAAPAEPIDLEDASDEEIELAMDWELLEDLELLEELDLLEAMAARSRRGQG